jgi:hypothetical protein
MAFKSEITEPTAAKIALTIAEKFALTISEFCAAHNISEAFYYELKQDGKAPREIKLGRRRLFSVEEAARRREARTTTSENEKAA